MFASTYLIVWMLDKVVRVSMSGPGFFNAGRADGSSEDSIFYGMGRRHVPCNVVCSRLEVADAIFHLKRLCIA